MEAEGKTVSIASLCRWFGLPRSSFYYRPTPRTVRRCDPEKVRLVRAIIDENPGYGVRRLTAVARKRSAEPVNRKSVHRILKENSWQVRRRPRGQRPRVAGWRSESATPNERWAVDATHVFCVTTRRTPSSRVT